MYVHVLKTKVDKIYCVKIKLGFCNNYTGLFYACSSVGFFIIL